MILRQDLLAEDSPKGLEIYQLTKEEDVPSSHLYMEAQVFTPDSKRLLVHRSAHAHGSDKDDPEHRYLVCDLENGGELMPITEETGATAPSVSPDGEYVYYFVDRTEIGSGSLTLKRVRTDGTGRDTVLVIDAPIPGTDFRPSLIYPLSTMRSDGRAIALSCFLRDGEREDLPWGLMVFDLDQATVRVAMQGMTWINMHPQYTRSRAPQEYRDVLIQENHGYFHAPRDGRWVVSSNGKGADIHVVRDDGAGFRNMPWGRDGNEFCQGHQCWIGRTNLAITSTGTRQPHEQQLIAGKSAPFMGHVGLATPGGVRNDLSRDFRVPHFCHFQTDIQGRRMVSDYRDKDGKQGVYLMDLPEDPLVGALSNYRRIANDHSSWKKQSHPHPFLSPDGTMAFFNSDESGILQAYMVRGW